MALLAPTLALLVGGASAACESGEVPLAIDERTDSGPLAHDGGQRGGMCVPTKPASAVTVGMEVLQNTTGDAVRVDSVGLVEPHGLDLVGADVVQVSGDLIGNGAAYPPPSSWTSIPGFRWNNRQPAVGATVPAYATSNLVLGVRPAGTTEGTAKAIEVSYTAGGRSFLMRTTNQIVVKVAPRTCD